MSERNLDDVLGVEAGGERLWEVFHENSKNERSGLALSEQSPEAIHRQMRQFNETLSYHGYPRVPLPERLALGVSLDEAMLARQSIRAFVPRRVTLEEVSTILHFSYGMIRDNSYGTHPPRTRVVPSAGALYPLEIYFQSARVEGLLPGIYHFDPKRNVLHALGRNDYSPWPSTLYPDLVRNAALNLFITAAFERTSWKYGDRGYRYVLFEAGHVAQNATLAATALGLASFSLGGFVDREVDDALGLDGVTHSTLYMLCLGDRPEDLRP